MVNSTAKKQRAASGAPSEIVKESFALLRGLSAPGVGFSNFETNYLFFSSISRTKRLRM